MKDQGTATREITLGSLFDGAGGFPLAGTLAGITPKWASEIEPFPIRVTTKRFPDMKHIGNITEVSGADIEPVDIITFGSPCQDLSVANCGRKGLQGARSGLFLEAIRIIKEMREKTHGRKPEFAVWENVVGAFSSNGGEDFRIVLEEIAKIKDPGVCIPRYPDGRWPYAGENVGNGYSIAWRTVDAQFWGVPQRRRRIYLVADFRADRAGKIQFECDRLCGNFTAGAGEGQETAGTAGDDADCTSGHGTIYLTGWDNQEKRIFSAQGVAPTLSGSDGGGGRTGCGYVMYKATSGTAGGGAYPSIARSLTARNDGSPCLDRGPNIVLQPVTAFHLTQDPITSEGIAPCLSTGNPNSGQATVGVMMPVAYRLVSKASNAWKSGNPYKARTLNCMHDAQAAIIPTDGGFPYIVRRLMPLECCRLQGYPDGHAQNLDTPEPTEEEIDWWCEVFETHRKAVKPDTKPKSRNQVRKWLQHPSSDSAECKMWGNSLAIPNAYHVLAGIAEEIRAEWEGQPESVARPQRCKKCGRLLTREDSIKQGMGHRCAEKAYQQENTQMTIWDFIGKEG